MTVGELESVVQARPADKAAKPGKWREHAYELSLVTPQVAADDNASAPRPASAPPPVVLDAGAPPKPGDAWRCASCYNTRFTTMCFGENPPGSGAACKFCGQSPEAAGWTVWKAYAELPVSVQRRIDRANGPKALAVLRTRWPDAVVSVVRADGDEAEMGTAAFDPAAFPLPGV